MDKRAFTLIEVMVVLSVLAIIAILAYNFFGGTMKDATLTQQVTKIKRDLQTISDAIILYESRGLGTISNVDADPSLLVSTGVLKSLPTPPPVFTAGFETNQYRIDEQYDRFGPASVQAPNPATDDDVVQVRNVTDDVCKKVNEENSWYSSYNIWDYNLANGEPARYPTEGIFFCVEWSGSNKVFLLHELRE